MKKLLVLSGLLVFGFCVFAQTGDYFTTHFTPTGQADPASNFDLVQQKNGIITIANRSGILQFDGRNWDLYDSKGTPTSLSLAADGIYAAGLFGIGFFPLNNPAEFFTLHDDGEITDIIEIKIIGDHLYAISSNKLFIFSTIEKKLLNSISIEFNYLQKILNVQGKAVAVTSTGNFWINEEDLVFAEQLPQEELSFSVTYEGTNILGTAGGNLFKFSSDAWQKVEINQGGLEEQLNKISFREGILIKDRVLVISTVNEGLLIIDVNNFKVEKVMDQSHGLPDDEIFFLSADMHGGIWIGHTFGLSRIDINLPYEVYQNFPGLSGHLQTMINHNNIIYVGTSTGLYQLQETKDYEEIVYYVKKELKEQESNEIQENTRESKGLFAFLKRNKDNDKEDLSGRKGSTDNQLQQRVKRKVKGTKYVYKRNETIDGKVVQLLSAKDELLAVTLNGVYSVKDNKADLFTTKPIKFSWLNNSADFLIANTYDGQLLSFEKKGNIWKEAFHFEGFRDLILDVYQDSADRIWFVSDNEIYWTKYDEGQIFAGEEFIFSNPYLHPTYISENAEGQVVFKNKVGVWHYSEAQNNILLSEKYTGIEKFIRSSKNLWEYENGKWTDSKGFENQWLNIFDNVKQIEKDKNNNIYVITNSEQFLKISADIAAKNISSAYPIIIKSIKENEQEVKERKRLKFIQKQSDLTFEVIQPEYSGIVEVNYQYRVKGISENWSEWSRENNIVKLPFLPDGEYELEIRTITDFGEEQRLSGVSFEVVPPYWKRPLFYAFEFTFLALLLFITIHLNHNAPRYRLLNKLLAFLTLVLIIEFIQIVAESNFSTDFSPVATFFIQVLIAFTVLPVEGFLRNIIIKEKKIAIMKYFGIRGSK